ncbi:MAG: Ig-like domain-containing protein, partial [Lachnospiraceae bacterium]|nr:Ig-like domain-containing protein [Lachnospiraceae bacterium]
MKKMKSLRLSIAVFLIISLIIQPNLVTYGAQVQVEPDKSSVSANISNPETTEEPATESVVDIKHIPGVSPKIETGTKPEEDHSKDHSEQTAVPVADPIKMMEENPTAVPGSEMTSEPSVQVTPMPTVLPKADERNTVSEDKPVSDNSADTGGDGAKSEEKDASDKNTLDDIKSGLFGMLGISPEGAGDTTWQNDFTYVLDGPYIMLAKYNGNATSLEIPAKAVVDGKEYRSKLYLDCSLFFKSKKTLLTIDLSKVDSSDVTYMNSMFSGCTSLKEVNFDGFDTDKLTNMNAMFDGCSSLENPGVDDFDTGKVTDMGYMFRGCNSLTSLDLSNFDTGKVTSMKLMFCDCNSLTSLDLSSFNTGNVTDMNSMFFNCSNLTSIDLSSFDTGNVTDMSYMFYGCSSLTGIDLSGFDTGSVTVMSAMFRGCSGLTNLDVSNFDTANVTHMDHMFNRCSNLTSLDLSNFDTGNVNSMYNMFYGCSGLTSLDVSNFDTGNVTHMDNMFNRCSNLTSLDLSNFDTGNVTSMSYMFYGCSGLTSLDVSNFDTGNVVGLIYMFYDCSSLTSLDLSSFDMSKVSVTASNGMLTGTAKLIQIEVPRYVRWQIELPDTFVKKTDPSSEYIMLPYNVAESFTIVRKASDVHVTGITLEPAEKSIEAGEGFTIIPTVEPADASNKTVIWTSSDEAVATVDDNGKVTGISEGDATITATTVDGGYTAECVVTVTGSKIDVTGITVDPTARTIEENEEFVVVATIIPDNATDKGVTFTSSDPLVAAVDEDGKVTGISEGEATITATTNDGNKKARCKVTVLKRKKDVTGITVEPASKTINTGEEFIISPTVTPDDATDKSVTWTSSDTDIAVVDRDGKVTGKAPGTVTITATTNDGGFTAGCTVTVIEEEEERVILNKYDISLYEGDRELIIATVKPDSVADKSVTWSSSDPAVATVDEHGWIEAVKAGVAVITATSKNGKTADCIVTVISRTVSVESITADPVSKTIFIGESFFITTTITPADATDKGVTWSSDDPVIASVYRGSVTGYSVGTTTVRVRTNDGGKEASCIVTVKERPVEVKSIILDPTEDQIFINETLPISAKVLPENAVDKTLKWTTNNPSVATVDNNGNVRGVGLGEAIIT